ncbi:MAG: hypothetical protein F6K56_00190 [Moorea sp. SIO3G5]|nr:hypothetical protein [Moorena sp. SIO3G5]
MKPLTRLTLIYIHTKSGSNTKLRTNVQLSLPPISPSPHIPLLGGVRGGFPSPYLPISLSNQSTIFEYNSV